jgi:hypothetical protein
MSRIFLVVLVFVILFCFFRGRKQVRKTTSKTRGQRTEDGVYEKVIELHGKLPTEKQVRFSGETKSVDLRVFLHIVRSHLVLVEGEFVSGGFGGGSMETIVRQIYNACKENGLFTRIREETLLSRYKSIGSDFLQHLVHCELIYEWLLNEASMVFMESDINRDTFLSKVEVETHFRTKSMNIGVKFMESNDLDGDSKLAILEIMFQLFRHSDEYSSLKF